MTLIIAIIVAVNHNRMAEVSLVIMAAVVLHNMIGLVSGYGFTKLFGYDKRICRTVAIEVGMQNSGLSVVLAIKYDQIAYLAEPYGFIASTLHLRCQGNPARCLASGITLPDRC